MRSKLVTHGLPCGLIKYFPNVSRIDRQQPVVGVWVKGVRVVRQRCQHIEETIVIEVNNLLMN